MAVLDRTEFAQLWHNINAGLGDIDSPLWHAEHNLDNQCNYFVAIKPIWFFDQFQPNRHVFWDWCSENLSGGVACFSCNAHEEWWGFEKYDDVTLFLLKWS